MPKSELEELQEQAARVAERIKTLQSEQDKQRRVEFTKKHMENAKRPDMPPGHLQALSDVTVQDGAGTRLTPQGREMFDEDTLVGGASGGRSRHEWEMKNNPKYRPPVGFYTRKVPDYLRRKPVDPSTLLDREPADIELPDEPITIYADGPTEDVDTGNPEDRITIYADSPKPLPKAEPAGMFDKKEKKKK
jgi:hypothetical protein